MQNIKREKFHPFSMLLHWVLAIAILGVFVAGVYMSDLPMGLQKLMFYSWHKWIGMLILAFSVVRVLWRFKKPAPAYSADTEARMLPWQKLASKLTHFALYILFFLTPLAGWIYSSMEGFPVVLFGKLPIPNLVAPNEEWAPFFKEAHGAIAWALVGLVFIHVAAVVKHKFFDKDDVFYRMNPFSKKI